MKQTIAIVVLSILLTVTGIFAFTQYKNASYWKNAANAVVTIDRSKEGNYNKADVSIVEKIEDVDVTDKKLKETIKEKRITEIVYIEVDKERSGRGTASVESTYPTVPTTFTFSDNRVRLWYEVPTKEFRYSLLSKYKINLYVSEGLDYRLEMLEINRETDELTDTFEVTDFLVIKEKDDKKKLNFGFNLMVGAGTTFSGYWDWDVHAMMNFMSYGKTHLDSDWRFLSLGIGKEGPFVAPVSYNIGRFIPFFSDLHVSLGAGMTYRQKPFGILALGTTL